jgi:hypothetical protein
VTSICRRLGGTGDGLTVRQGGGGTTSATGDQGVTGEGREMGHRRRRRNRGDARARDDGRGQKTINRAVMTSRKVGLTHSRLRVFLLNCLPILVCRKSFITQTTRPKTPDNPSNGCEPKFHQTNGEMRHLSPLVFSSIYISRLPIPSAKPWRRLPLLFPSSLSTAAAGETLFASRS